MRYAEVVLKPLLPVHVRRVSQILLEDRITLEELADERRVEQVALLTGAPLDTLIEIFDRAAKKKSAGGDIEVGGLVWRTSLEQGFAGSIKALQVYNAALAEQRIDGYPEAVRALRTWTGRIALPGDHPAVVHLLLGEMENMTGAREHSEQGSGAIYDVRGSISASIVRDSQQPAELGQAAQDLAIRRGMWLNLSIGSDGRWGATNLRYVEAFSDRLAKRLTGREVTLFRVKEGWLERDGPPFDSIDRAITRVERPVTFAMLDQAGSRRILGQEALDHAVPMHVQPVAAHTHTLLQSLGPPEDAGSLPRLG